VEIKAGSANGFTVQVQDSGGKPIAEIPDNVSLILESSHPGVASVNHDDKNPLRFTIVGIKRGAAVITVSAVGTNLDTTTTMAITVVDDAPGAAAIEAKLKTASVSVMPD